MIALENLSRRYGFNLDNASYDEEPMLVGDEADAIARELNKIEPSSDNDNTKDRLLVARIQKQLIRLGFYKGEVDGLENEQTKNAIKSFQKDYQLSIDGKATDKLLSSIKNH